MLGPYYISQKPDNARACCVPKPAGFLESPNKLGYKDIKKSRLNRLDHKDLSKSYP